MDRKKSNKFIWIIILLLIIFFVWGYLGEKHIEKEGIECDKGISDNLCWSWSTGNMDKFEENIQNKTSLKLREFTHRD